MHATCTEKLEEEVERNKEKQVEKEAQLRVFTESDRPWLFLFYDRVSDFTLTFHFHALEKEMAPHSSILA